MEAQRDRHQLQAVARFEGQRAPGEKGGGYDNTLKTFLSQQWNSVEKWRKKSRVFEVSRFHFIDLLTLCTSMLTLSYHAISLHVEQIPKLSTYDLVKRRIIYYPHFRRQSEIFDGQCQQKYYFFKIFSNFGSIEYGNEINSKMSFFVIK